MRSSAKLVRCLLRLADKSNEPMIKRQTQCYQHGVGLDNMKHYSWKCYLLLFPCADIMRLRYSCSCSDRGYQLCFLIAELCSQCEGLTFFLWAGDMMNLMRNLPWQVMSDTENKMALPNTGEMWMVWFPHGSAMTTLVVCFKWQDFSEHMWSYAWR